MRAIQFIVAVSIIASSGFVSNTVWGEYPGLDSAMRTDVERLGKALSGKTVLVSIPDPNELNRQWRLTAAIETEIVAQLLELEVEAVDEDDDERFQWLARSNSKSIERWQKDPIYDVLLVGGLTLNESASELKLTLTAVAENSSEPLIEVTATIPSGSAALSANVPPRNLLVSQFAESNKGKTIGTGICATAATEALKHSQSERYGLYDWGRRLGKNEALLPGDIVQLEYANFKRKKGGDFELVHHTAIISKIIDSNSFKVLHQNVGNKEVKKTMTEGMFDMTEHKSGAVVFFRPTIAGNALQVDPTPFRKGPARIVKNKAGLIDLKRTIDPELDSVHGIWGIWNDAICSHKDKFLKLQIPVDVPESYIIRARIKRTWGNDTYAIILNVGGHQCLLGIDSYGGTKCGLEMISGKKIKGNVSTRETKTNVLPLNQSVSLMVKVTPNSVVADVDGETIVDWSGDPANFSLQEAWRVPNKSRIHLGTYLSVFDTESLTMEIVQ